LVNGCDTISSPKDPAEAPANPNDCRTFAAHLAKKNPPGFVLDHKKPRTMPGLEMSINIATRPSCADLTASVMRSPKPFVAMMIGVGVGAAMA
jgi:enoyl-CoA hydratase/carnithine racemase